MPRLAHRPHGAAAAIAALALALAGTAAVAQPAPKLKPGLWEHAFQTGSRSGELERGMKEAQAAMAKMPPEQRKMMEQMMASQGVSFDAAGQKVRICMTPEDATRDEPPPAQDGCTQKTSRSGNTWTVSFQCPARDGQPASSGRGTVTLQSPTAYAGDFTVDTEAKGKPERMTMKTQGKWLSADCGAVKPVRR